jgi:hypothetical protein
MLAAMPRLLDALALSSLSSRAKTSRRFSSRLLTTIMPIEMTASELQNGGETDISTLPSADILALLLHCRFAGRMLWNMPLDPRTQLYSFCCFLISPELTLIATKLIVMSQRDFEAMAPGNTAPGGYALKSFATRSIEREPADIW